MVRNFIDYWNDENPDDKFPETPTVNGTWFSERGLPMVVACTCCQMTMALPSAVIDDDGNVYCPQCAEE